MKTFLLIFVFIYFAVLIIPKEESKGIVKCENGKCFVVKVK